MNLKKSKTLHIFLLVIYVLEFFVKTILLERTLSRRADENVRSFYTSFLVSHTYC